MNRWMKTAERYGDKTEIISVLSNEITPVMIYQSLTPQQADVAIRAEERIKTREVLRVIENGRDLIEVKEVLGHGNFMTWAKQAFPIYNHFTLTRWMNAAERYGDKLHIMCNLNDTVMMLLAAPSTPDEVREDVEARALAGEKITVAEVQELKREAARAKEEAERLKAERERTIDDLRRRLDSEAEERRKLTARLVDHTGSPERASFWKRLLDQLRSQ